MCNASGQCVAPDALPCPPVRLQRQQVLHRVHHRRAVRGAQHLHRQLVRAQGQRRVVHGRERVQERLLRAGRLLRSAPAPARASPCVAGMLGRLLQRRHRRGRIRKRAVPDQGGATCGTNGRCEAGACQRYASGTPCLEPNVPGGDQPVHGAVDVQRRRRLRRTAQRPDCFPYQCGANACNAVVHRRTPDCRPPAVCTNGTLRAQAPRRGLFRRARVPLRILRTRCLLPDRVHRGLQVVRAGTPRAARAATRSRGDTDARCSDMGPASCSTDGFCDGIGGCRLYDASTTCAPPSCGDGTVDVDHRPHLRRPRRLPGGGRRSPARPMSATAPPRAGPRAPATPTACPTTSATCRSTVAATRSAWASPCRLDGSVPDRQLLRRRRLLQQPVLRAVPGV